nr:MAG TPA: hypothetical protein [Caudoviricetes sp.]
MGIIIRAFYSAYKWQITQHKRKGNYYGKDLRN